MQYQPGLPEHNDNVSHQRPGREFLSLVVVVVFLVLAVAWVAGLAVDWAVGQVDPKTERQLLAKVGQSMEFQPAGYSDEQARLVALLKPLLACVDQPYDVQPVITDDEQLNAFAVPGGQMWVTTGLLNSGISENALSFVLGHELGHFAHRDHLRGLGRALVFWVLSRSLLGGDSRISQLLSPTLLFGEAQYSQARERAADATGLAALQCRYGHVGGATEFFEQLLVNHPKSLPGTHYFDSHPQLQERIASLRLQARQQGMLFGEVRPY